MSNSNSYTMKSTTINNLSLCAILIMVLMTTLMIIVDAAPQKQLSAELDDVRVQEEILKDRDEGKTLLNLY